MVKEGIHRLTYSPAAMPSLTAHAHLGLSDACRNKGGLTMNSIRVSMPNLPEPQSEKCPSWTALAFIALINISQWAVS